MSPERRLKSIKNKSNFYYNQMEHDFFDFIGGLDDENIKLFKKNMILLDKFIDSLNKFEIKKIEKNN
jgi:hypothetical protein